MKPRLLIVASHPIQYQAPWFRALHADGRIQLKVLFLNLPNRQQQGVGFAHDFEWDVPLLDGYDWQLAPSAIGSINEGWAGLQVRSALSDLRSQSPDVCLVLGWHKLGLAQFINAARRLRVPWIVRGDSNGLAPVSFPAILRNRFLLRGCPAVAVVGKANSTYYEVLGLEFQKQFQISHFVDADFFATRAKSHSASKAELQRQWKIPAGTLCVLFVGKFVEKKRPGDLLDAMQELSRTKNSSVHLLMVGTGPIENTLRQRAAREKLPITFTGFLNQTEIPAAYAVADCLVLPSDYGETWGLVVNEAMACGLPAIVSDRVGCGPDLVRHGETGFTFRFGSVGELATRLTEFASMDADARHAMGQRARELLFRDYSIERAVENTVAAVQDLVGRARRSAVH